MQVPEFNQLAPCLWGSGGVNVISLQENHSERKDFLEAETSRLRGQICILILGINSYSQMALLRCYGSSISPGSLLDRSHYWLLVCLFVQY